MNPYVRFKNWIIGDALASTEDVFLQVRINVLFSFTLFFFVVNIPYLIISFSLSFVQLSLGLISLGGLLSVLATLRITKNLKAATLIYIGGHFILNTSHFITNNGSIEAQGILFFTLMVLFGFLMLGRQWGFILTCYIVFLILLGSYNTQTDLSLFSIPKQYLDPVATKGMTAFLFIPIGLNIFLISQFVKANLNAEKQINDQKIELEKNNKHLESKNEDILSSINYAKRIQNAVLPNEETIYRSIPLSFIIYKPRDIVSGDFFWFHEIDRDKSIIVAADCTGHGVPGAFMTVIGSNVLTQTVIENKITKPADILLELDNKVTSTLKQEKTHFEIIQDGMDISLLKIDRSKKEFVFTSAKRPLFFIRNGELKEFKGSKSSIGGLRSEEKKFDEIAIQYLEDDMVYLFTDGIVDQFGGTNNKKFTTKRLRELLLSISKFPVNEQKQKVIEAIDSWRGDFEQTDDVLILGIRF